MPTLVAPQGVIDAADAGIDLPPAVVDKARRSSRSIARRSGDAVEAGVRIAMGTDSGVTPHGRNLRELELMVEGGMTPAAALEATTRSAAELMGLDDDLGTIEPGKLADLVVVERRPVRRRDARRSGRAGLEGRRPGDLIGRCARLDGRPGRPRPRFARSGYSARTRCPALGVFLAGRVEPSTEGVPA